MGIKFANNAVSALTAGITSGATSLTVTTGDGSKFPVLGDGDYFRVTLQSAGAMEIVKVTARSVDTFTIVRGEEGTLPTAFASGSSVSLYITNQDLIDLTSAIGVAGGVHSNVQYNDSGYLSGNSQLTYAKATGSLTASRFLAPFGAYNAPAFTFSPAGTTGFFYDLTNVNIGFAHSGVYAHGFSYNFHVLPSTSKLGWGIGAPYDANVDVALGRNAAGVVEVNNGTGGTFADLRLRYLSASKGIRVNASVWPWAAPETVIDVSDIACFRGTPASSEIVTNLYYDGANWRYKVAGGAMSIQSIVYGGGDASFAVAMAPIGAAGGVATLAPKFGVAVDGSASTAKNMLVGGGLFVRGDQSYAATGTGIEMTYVSTVPCTVFQSFNRDTATWLTSRWYAKDHEWWIGGAQKMTLDSGGNLAVSGQLSVPTAIIGATTGQMYAGPAGKWLEVRSAGGVGDAAYMAFHRPGAYAALFGLDVDNTWRVGGWSTGAASYKILHEGNSWGLSDPSYLNSNGKNIVAHQNSDAGVIYLGNSLGHYHSFDGATHAIGGGHVALSNWLAVGISQSPITPLMVHVGAQYNFVANYGPIGASNIGSMSDSGGAWNTLCLGGGATTVGPCYDNMCTLGYDNIRWMYVYAVSGVIQTSDAREKRNIEPSALGLDFIESLNPVSYQRIVGKNEVTRVPDYEEEVPERQDIDGNIIPATTRTIYKDVVTPLPGVRTHYGLIAQDVQRAVVASGVADFGGYIPAEADAPDGLQGLCYTEFIAPLIKAVKELSAKVKALEAQVGIKP